MKFSILIPSYRRPEMLRKCLERIAGQTRPADEIAIGVREGDEKTRQAAEEFGYLLPRFGVSSGPGVVAAMNAALAECSGDIIALLDDDALPHSDWLERIERHFMSDEALLGVGGIDLQANPEQTNPSGRALRVGVFTLTGKLLGNHHLGSGAPQGVHVLKGCNCAYRGDFLREVGFDSTLRGGGAEVGWEVALGLEAMRRNRRVLYDPRIRVDHLIAPRHDSDNIHRGRYNRAAAYDIAWNYFSIVRRKAPPFLAARIVCREISVGSRSAPGVLRIVDSRIGDLRERCSRIATTLNALIAVYKENYCSGTGVLGAAPSEEIEKKCQ